MVNKRRGRPVVRRPSDRLARKRRPPIRRVVGVLALASLVAAVAGALWLTSSGGNDSSPAVAGQDHAGGATTVMATGTSSAGGVEVSESSVDLGHVPLNTAVERTFVLRNTGTERVSLGKVKIEALEGC